MSGYDRALTVFSPNGQLFQVEYALEAVKQGTTVVGVRGESAVAVAVERKTAQTLQDPRTLRKVVSIDDHILCAFAGLNADARVLIDLARQECQQYRLTVEDAPGVEYVARFVAETQQKYTHKGGARPFGVSCLLVGPEETATGESRGIRLYQTDPSGVFYAYKATAIGRNGKSVSDWLEKKYSSAVLSDEHTTVKFCLEALLSVVDAKNIELWVYQGAKPRRLDDQTVLDLAKQIEAEQAAMALEEKK